MRKILFVLGLVVATAIPFGTALGQFDPNCYFPKIGKAGEIDTIYGGSAWQELSAYRNIGPAKAGEPSRFLFSGLTTHPPFITAVNTGAGFNLKKLVASGSTFHWYFHPSAIILGHFRDKEHADIFDRGQIYWSDDAGNYDSNRTTLLTFDTIRGGGSGYGAPYVARLSQDSIDDIVLVGDNGGAPNDSIFMAYYRGGPHLAMNPVAYEDSMVSVRKYSPRFAEWRSKFQGDWRGVGRQDLIGCDRYGNLFYYRNDPPFSFLGLVNAMMYDTLFARWQNPAFRFDSTLDNYLTGNSFRALSKSKGNHSVDLITGFPLFSTDPRNLSFFIFRGGPNFGDHRWTLDSVAFNFHAPSIAGIPAADFGVGLADCGDMTGSGNHVMFFQGIPAPGTFAVNCFYVMGDELDEKVDMEFEYSSNDANPDEMLVDGIDSLDADGDRYGDVALGLSNFATDEDFLNRGLTYVGSVQIVHSLGKIPLHNSRVVRTEADRQALQVFPNPAKEIATVSFDLGTSEFAHIIWRDLLGRIVRKSDKLLHGGKVNVEFNVGSLPGGSYQVSVVTPTHHFSFQTVVIH